MYILAVDPGVHTGVALLNPEGEPVWTLTCEDPYEELDSSMAHYVDAEVVMETAPNTRHYQQVYQTILAMCNGDGRTVHLIRPSEWKNHPFCQERFGMCRTKHEAEAVGIGRAHLLKRGKSEQTGSTRPGSDREHPRTSGHLSHRAGTVSDL